ncbi:basic proline-rich protein-like [Vidua macroura]|uniref:basic proline-rich protein-like n=1 Tax=Vidua macroura TaxID=187451 RepID=UPI0023A7B479|nr:basic proline-rich protein-like [Vidua macroura]
MRAFRPPASSRRCPGGSPPAATAPAPLPPQPEVGVPGHPRRPPGQCHRRPIYDFRCRSGGQRRPTPRETKAACRSPERRRARSRRSPEKPSGPRAPPAKRPQQLRPVPLRPRAGAAAARLTCGEFFQPCAAAGARAPRRSAHCLIPIWHGPPERMRPPPARLPPPSRPSALPSPHGFSGAPAPSCRGRAEPAAAARPAPRGPAPTPPPPRCPGLLPPDTCSRRAGGSAGSAAGNGTRRRRDSAGAGRASTPCPGAAGRDAARRASGRPVPAAGCAVPTPSPPPRRGFSPLSLGKNRPRRSGRGDRRFPPPRGAAQPAGPRQRRSWRGAGGRHRPCRPPHPGRRPAPRALAAAARGAAKRKKKEAGCATPRSCPCGGDGGEERESPPPRSSQPVRTEAVADNEHAAKTFPVALGREHSAPAARDSGARARQEPPRGSRRCPRTAPAGLERFLPAVPFPGAPARPLPLPFPPRPGPSARGGSRHADPQGPAERSRPGTAQLTVQTKPLPHRLIESQQTPPA